MGRSLTVILKPTNACNLSCKYCCVEKDAWQGRMDLKTLERCVQEVMAIPGKETINWIWHGGEPTLMGVTFFAEAVRLQRTYQGKHRVRNNIQTNVTLLNDEFIDFLIENEFKITTSIDGPQTIHDRTRVYPDGKGSFEDVWEVVQKLRHRVLEKIAKGGRHPGLGIICVLTKKNITEIDRLYEFFSANEIALNLNPLIHIGRALEDAEGLSLKGDEYGIALTRFFDRWFYEKNLGIEVKPLSDILFSLIAKTKTGCQFAGSCRGNFISIGPQGDVYPCGRFDGVREYLLGNIHKQSLHEMFNSKKHVEIDNQRWSAISDDCKTCSYRDVCNSGCMFDAYLTKENGGKKDPYCASYKILFSHVENALKKELSKVGAEKYAGVY